MTNICPTPGCGRRMSVQTWRDDIWGAMQTVEKLAKCDGCRYVYHWSYGTTLWDGIMEQDNEGEYFDDGNLEQG